MAEHPPLCISYSDIVAAAERIKGVANITPVISSHLFNESTNSQHEVFFKCENLQRSGSFKFRGAYNKVAQLTDEERKKGVIAFSSGNHAQGLALAAKLKGVPAVIIMPEDAPPSKIGATKEYGAEVILYNRLTTDRQKLTQRIAEERGLVLIPPFDNKDIMAGQGTLAKELIEEVKDLDCLVVPVGGGGMISGCAVAAKHLLPNITIIGVEAVGADSVIKSLEQNKIVTIPPPSTIADGIRTTTPGTLTMPVIRKCVDKVVLIEDKDIIEAMKFAATRMKLVLEPTGATAMAAVMRGLIPSNLKRVGVVLCGGNVDTKFLAEILASA
jgi:threonine dehydratase